ncbi:hypothetical protein [Methylobacterium sp. E-066]|uniref:hypothetical protein n=1 Tax=Methylobacterium sp. E-066 TaxID=2836584 RepID=UPI001FBA1727|nr:hypothetical protein [Methylobacterium sp. E-066]MCJ2144732.1 hypothetical protein [Methylobacterium sp. E-066]
MVSHLVLITDAPRRGEGLVDDLGAVQARLMHDLDEEMASIWNTYAALIDRQPCHPLIPAKALTLFKEMADPLANVLVGAFCPVTAAIDP